MLKTCVPLVVPTEAGSLSNMGDTSLMQMEELSPHHQRVELNSLNNLQTTRVMPKPSVEPQHESLHSVLQKAISPSHHKPQTWQQQRPQLTSPQNLFLEGFRDCASEVLRFLTEEEKVDDNSPLLMGLQSHLATVSKAICQETIMDLDRSDAETENITTSSNDNTHDTSSLLPHASPTYLNPLSPVIWRPARDAISLSDTTLLDSDTSLSSVTDIHRLSVSSDNGTSVANTSSETHHKDMTDIDKSDDVFHHFDCQSTQQNTQSTHHTSPASLQNSAIMPLSHLARTVLECEHVSQQRQSSPEASQHQATSSTELHGCTGNTANSVSSPNVQYFPPIGQSSPIPSITPSQTVSVWQNPPSLSHSSSMTSVFMTDNNILNVTPTLDSFSTIGTVSTCTASHMVPGYLQQQLMQCHEANENVNHGMSYSQIPNMAGNDFVSQEHPSEVTSPLSSILELKANFLPGIDTSSVASGNFADILLAIESCRSHEDSRVRTLAERLVGLIHGDDMEDDDDDDYDEDDSDDENEGMNGENLNERLGENGDESGIEIMDESVDWGNAADMIEQ